MISLVGIKFKDSGRWLDKVFCAARDFFSSAFSNEHDWQEKIFLLVEETLNYVFSMFVDVKLRGGGGGERDRIGRLTLTSNSLPRGQLLLSNTPSSIVKRGYV